MHDRWTVETSRTAGVEGQQHVSGLRPLTDSGGSSGIQFPQVSLQLIAITWWRPDLDGWSEL